MRRRTPLHGALALALLLGAAGARADDAASGSALSSAGATAAPAAEPAAPLAAPPSAPSAAAPPSVPSAPADNPREQARSLGYAGVRTYAAGDYAAASEQLERAFAILPVPSLGLWSARALVKLQRFVGAERRYREIAKMRVDPDAPAVQQAAFETAKAELVELLPRIPSLRIQIAGAQPEQVTITLDGIPLTSERWSRGEPVDPGAHHIVGTHLGEQSAMDITAIEGRESEVLIRFATPEPVLVPVDTPPALSLPSPAPMAPAPVLDAKGASNPLKLGGWLALGAGAAGLALGGVAYLVARGEYDDMKANDTCQARICQPGAALDRFEAWRRVEVASLIAGGVLAVGGGTLLLVEPRLSRSATSQARRLDVRLGVSSVTLSGRF